MKISTKGQYALQMMLDLTINDTGEYITIKSIAKRQNLSEKYLEQIMNLLSRSGYVKSVRGAKGGYRLAGEPSKFTVGMILRAIEGDLSLVEITDNLPDAPVEECILSNVWKKMDTAINGVIDHITLEDLQKEYQGAVRYDYVI